MTYIASAEGWLFLAVVIDLFSRKVVGWSMRPDMQRNLVIDALDMAWFQRNPGQKTELIFHSDRGSQYASDDFREVLQEHGMTPNDGAVFPPFHNPWKSMKPISTFPPPRR